MFFCTLFATSHCGCTRLILVGYETGVLCAEQGLKMVFFNVFRGAEQEFLSPSSGKYGKLLQDLPKFNVVVLRHIEHSFWLKMSNYDSLSSAKCF